MIAGDREDVFELALATLDEFSKRTGARGRFICLYLGLRLMGLRLARLGVGSATPTGDIEHFLDQMFTKTHRREPYVVLTSAFGGSTSRTAPYSARTGARVPDLKYAVNTWRNNFGIQKGIGCPASAETISGLVRSPTVRLGCPHMQEDPEAGLVCNIQGTAYRGEEHSIWLRMMGEGYQVVDLAEPSVYEPYFRPSGARVPILPLMAALYSFAPTGVYPRRERVGIPDFAADFGYSLGEVEETFETDPNQESNARLLQAIHGDWIPALFPVIEGEWSPRDREVDELPSLIASIAMNTGIGAEVAIAQALGRAGWRVGYRGSQRGIGYDLECERDTAVLRVEVKSSVGFADLELTAAEWDAATRYGEEFVLAVVDFYGSDSQAMWFVRDPAGVAEVSERAVTHFVLDRKGVEILGLPVAARVDSARPYDVAAGRELLRERVDTLPRLRAVVGDRAYRGLAALAARQHITLDIKAPPPGVDASAPVWPLYKVEHAIAQLGRWRRLSRCYEGTVASARAWLEVASFGYLAWRATV